MEKTVFLDTIAFVIPIFLRAMDMKLARSRAFTLVELVVVITILAILAALGFLSVQPYVSDARDMARVADLSNLHRAFSARSIQGYTFPAPDLPVTLALSGVSIGSQWCVGWNTVGWAGNSPVSDPSGGCFTYATNRSKTRFQISAIMDSGTGSVITSVGQKAVFSVGDAVWTVFSLSNTGSLQGLHALFSGSVDMKSATGAILTAFPDTALVLWTGSSLTTLSVANADSPDVNVSDPSLSGYWDFETSFPSWGSVFLKDFSRQGNSATLTGTFAAGSSDGSIGRWTSPWWGGEAYVPDTGSLSFSGNFTVSSAFKTPARTRPNSAYKVLVLRNDSSSVVNFFSLNGYSVEYGNTSWTLANVAARSPDLILCDSDAWACDDPIFKTLYSAGYTVMSIGNDTLSVPQIQTTSGYASVPFSSATIVPSEKHPLANGWTAYDSIPDGRQGIVSLVPKAFSIAKNTTNGWHEAVYLEESGKGRWMHFQTISPGYQLVRLSAEYLLRDNIVSKGKNFSMYVRNGNVYGFINDNPVSSAVTPGVWHRMALVKENATMRFYLDGSKLSETSVPAVSETDVSDLIFGKTNWAVDETRIYGRALSSAEVSVLQTAR